MLLAGPISQTGTQSIFYVSMDSLPIILLILVGVELPLCIVVVLS